ncbi:MAG TPA: histidine phosphatase family protein [Bryobacteraceae bacterium]|nr:histidine phosphatase family protein [Bryobacteraceae bacterium]
MSKHIWLVRHGETEWSLSGQHTGRTDIPLTERGQRHARSLQGMLAPLGISHVLTSPLKRAFETCRLAGLGDQAQIEPNLQEWDYGDYDGRTTADIREEIPDWTIWTGGAAGGESIGDVARRADAVIERSVSLEGDVALFSHGHFLRILAARWIDMPPQHGQLLALDTASLSCLGFEHNARVLRKWNRTCGD